MGIIKPNNYTEEDLIFDRVMKAIAHPIRRKIIDQLKSNLYVTNVELCKTLNVKPPTMKAHLDILQKGNVINKSYATHYQEILINPEGFKIAIEFWKDLEKDLLL